MLIYHPVFDANHCAFRALMLLQEMQEKEIDIELFRLMDFYILFPNLLKMITPLPNELRSYKKTIKNIESPYENILNPKRVFMEVRRIQSIAFHHLLSKQLIDIDCFSNGKIKRTAIKLPENLQNELVKANFKNTDLFQLIVNGFGQVEFYGSKGLKRRTGLMEYRYDGENLNG
ncbi:hypothetical protein AC423_004689 [Salmonella enterica subsp. enterica]|nr:hypothetical protein [Salmonella enterica subsp. enterica]